MSSRDEIEAQLMMFARANSHISAWKVEEGRVIFYTSCGPECHCITHTAIMGLKIEFKHLPPIHAF